MPRRKIRVGGWELHHHVLRPSLCTLQAHAHRLQHAIASETDPLITFRLTSHPPTPHLPPPDDHTPRTVSINRSLLRAAGGPLEALVTAPFQEAQMTQIVLHECFQSFQVVRDFLYCKPIHMLNLTHDFPLVADRWGLTTLFDACFIHAEERAHAHASVPRLQAAELVARFLPIMAVVDVPDRFKTYLAVRVGTEIKTIDAYFYHNPIRPVSTDHICCVDHDDRVTCRRRRPTSICAGKGQFPSIRISNSSLMSAPLKSAHHQTPQSPASVPNGTSHHQSSLSSSLITTENRHSQSVEHSSAPSTASSATNGVHINDTSDPANQSLTSTSIAGQQTTSGETAPTPVASSLKPTQSQHTPSDSLRVAAQPLIISMPLPAPAPEPEPIDSTDAQTPATAPESTVTTSPPPSLRPSTLTQSTTTSSAPPTSSQPAASEEAGATGTEQFQGAAERSQQTEEGVTAESSSHQNPTANDTVNAQVDVSQEEEISAVTTTAESSSLDASAEASSAPAPEESSGAQEGESGAETSRQNADPNGQNEQNEQKKDETKKDTAKSNNYGIDDPMTSATPQRADWHGIFNIWDVFQSRDMLDEVIHYISHYGPDDYTPLLLDIVLRQLEPKLTDEEMLRLLREVDWDWENPSCKALESKAADAWSARAWRLLACARVGFSGSGTDIRMSWSYETMCSDMSVRVNELANRSNNGSDSESSHSSVGDDMEFLAKWHESTEVDNLAFSMCLQCECMALDHLSSLDLRIFLVEPIARPLDDAMLRREVSARIKVIENGCGCDYRNGSGERSYQGFTASPVKASETRSRVESYMNDGIHYKILSGPDLDAWMKRHRKQCGLVFQVRLYVYPLEDEEEEKTEETKEECTCGFCVCNGCTSEDETEQD